MKTTKIQNFFRESRLAGIILLVILLFLAWGNLASQWIGETPAVQAATAYNHLPIITHTVVFIPSVLSVFPPVPGTPVLNSIENSDQDNNFTVSWQNPGYGDRYVLEQDIQPAFSSPAIVYDGTATYWQVPDGGKIPEMYYYRVKNITPYGESIWSNVVSVRIHPLFVGLNISWDGNGYIRGYDDYDVGYHCTRRFDLLTEPDTIRGRVHEWYDPDPLGFGEYDHDAYYSVVTGDFKYSSNPGSDPAWKWSFSFKLPYQYGYINGQTISIDGQNFTVAGPKSGYTSFGTSIQYWEFVNKNKFLFWDGGGDWKQYIHAGEAILRYDAGPSRLFIYSDVKRRYYYQGEETIDTVQYIEWLSAATSLSGSPPIPDIEPIVDPVTLTEVITPPYGNRPVR